MVLCRGGTARYGVGHSKRRMRRAVSPDDGDGGQCGRDRREMAWFCKPGRVARLSRPYRVGGSL